MFLAVIIACASASTESCYPMVNNRRAFVSFEECQWSVGEAAQDLVVHERIYSISAYCFPLEFGEPV
jgi:hypothetical protein